LPSSYNKSYNLHCTQAGHGPPILLLHGFGANLATWQHLVPSLSKTRRVICVDLLGFGASPKPIDFDYSLRSQARVVLDFIEAEGLRDLILVGHSMGGGIALLVALELQRASPALLRGLVLIDAISYAQRLPLFVKLLRTPVVGRLAILLPVELQVRYVLGVAYYDRSKITATIVSEYADPLRDAAARSALLATARELIPADSDALASMFPTINVPTLVLWGKNDPIVPLANGFRLHQAIRDSSIAVVENCGHIPPEEMPLQTLDALNEFFLRVPQRQ
jgi:pimeloyl-ACP methyl ester carboxylesterase